MTSVSTVASYYGLRLDASEAFIQGYADGMRLDAKGQGKPCGRGFIAREKNCTPKGRKRLAADLKAGDAKAKARVATGKRNAQNQQKARRAAKNDISLQDLEKSEKRLKASLAKMRRMEGKSQREIDTEWQRMKLEGLVSDIHIEEL